MGVACPALSTRTCGRMVGRDRRRAGSYSSSASSRGTRRCWRPKMAAWVRSASPSLARMLETCALTVSSPIVRVRAIWRLERPPADHGLADLADQPGGDPGLEHALAAGGGPHRGDDLVDSGGLRQVGERP